MKVGDEYGRLVAVAPLRAGKSAKWTFQCICGNTKTIAARSVSRGQTKSCGCLHLERCKAGVNQLRHGDARVGGVTRLHKIWRGMLGRCNADLENQHPRYAGRGIRVCSEWSRYEAFKAWAEATGYSEGLTIERNDNDGDYTPENCRWVLKAEQAKNRRTSRRITHEGKTMILQDWSRETGLEASTILYRLRAGWTTERALTVPPMPKPGRPKSASHFEIPI